MNLLRFPLFFSMLLVAGYVLNADVAFSVVLDIPDCKSPCTTRYKVCFDTAKESPNDIERELCENEQKDCLARCDAEVSEITNEYKRKVQEEKQDRLSRGLKEKKNAEEREEEYDNAEQEKQEQLKKAEQELREQQEKAAEEKRNEETINGTIKIYQFGN